jgi:hypothetical protein
MMEAQFKAKAANPDEKTMELEPRFVDGQIVTRSVGWPRSFVAVTDFPQDVPAQFVYQIRQDSAQEPYRLVAWARMLPGAELPATAPAEVGSAEVAPGSAGLAMSPQAALAAYAAAKGDSESAQAALFDTAPRDGVDPDLARARWGAQVQAMANMVDELNSARADFAGKVSQSSEAVEGSVFAVATAGSGALVFGQVKSTVTISGSPGEGSVNLGAKGYAGLGAATLEVRESATIEHLQTVVLAVPPAKSKDPIRVVAVADTPVAVTVK